MKTRKKFFIALNTDTYTVPKDFYCINLNWQDSIKKWIKDTKKYLKDCEDSSIIIGHSIGASIALICAQKGNLELYSPSPIFKETKNILNLKMKNQLGNKIYEIDKILLSNIKIKPHVYVGSKEHSVIKNTAKIIKKNIDCSITYLKDKDHLTVLKNSNLISYKDN